MKTPKSVLSGAVALAAATALGVAVPAPAAQTAGPSSSARQTAAGFAAAAATVTIGDDYFNPGNVSVGAGQTVTWTNTGDNHTVTGAGFDSGDMVGGETYRRTFNTAGSYPYVCSYHDDMRGTVTVTAPVRVSVVSFGPTPLRLAGPGRLRAVYQTGQASTLRAKVQHLQPTRTVRTFPRRSIGSAGRSTYYWDGRNNVGSNVRPGSYRMGLTVTNRAGSSRTVWRQFRVVR